MRVVLFQMRCKPERRQEFIAALLRDASETYAREPGCLRFDVVQEDDDPDKFYLYEVYESAAAYAAHRETAHAKRAGEAFRDLRAGPSIRSEGTNLFPADDRWR